MIKNIFASIGFLTILVLFYLLASGLGFISISGNTQVAALLSSGTATGKSTPNNVPQTVNQVPLPSTLDFAGEPVPLHQSDVEERLDRELMSITYKHASTALIMKLANRWLPTIEAELRKNNIPDDFKYLAIAESGLENAISSKEARGFWQFLAPTAKGYGLEVSDDVDERYHIEKSTQAACQYLRQAYNRYGNWTMAAAAYNMGMSGAATQMDNQRQNNYYELFLNPETYRYVFRILAYKQLLTQPQLYGFYLAPQDLYPPYGFTEVQVASIPDVATFAQQYGKTYQDIKILNPWMRNKYVRARPNKVYTVKLPN